ncbi:envelope protein UL131A [Cercopithecine betaherpesvirus 5]|uniref:Envelope protein UL131A n=1 Tax=Simian cytomegalovirus (strain Colburn) TaxID=50292 RepID=G8XTI1_SCMVC|nr:envelope protein UL131A [Cercopithecine betaherpesvirus 5]AEV80471.1 envelope protein UL131A [Cercopithecine betaherpesvirus 5]
MGAWCVFICVSVLCYATAVQGLCSQLYADFSPHHRLESYWDLCAKVISNTSRNKFFERIVNTTLTYHYDVSHGRDSIDVLQRINVTEVSLLVNLLQDRAPDLAKNLKGELKEVLGGIQFTKGAVKTTLKDPSFYNVDQRNLITFGASSSLNSFKRILFISVRLPIAKLTKKQ